MNLKKRHSQILSTLLFFAGTLFGSNAITGEKPGMMIDIETDDVHIQELDISHLTPGDTETIYTDDGRVIDVMRKEQGVDIFIDGERLDLPALMDEPHAGGHREIHKFLVSIDCDADSDPDCAEENSMRHEGWAAEVEHDARHIVIIKELVEEEDEI